MPGESAASSKRDPASRDELRTIAFRLREIQRLMAVRVEQENRRIEMEGGDPVTDTTQFRKHPGEE